MEIKTLLTVNDLALRAAHTDFRSCLEICQKFFYGSFRSALSFFFQSDSQRYPFQKSRTEHPRKQLIKFMSTNFKNSFLVKPEPHDGPTESDHAAGDPNRREKHRSQPHWKYAAERIQLRQVTPIPSDRSQSAAMHISRMPAAVTGVLRNPATPSLRTFPPFMICDPDERKNTFHGRMLRTGLGGDGSWTVRRNQPRRPWRSGAGGCGRCMVSEGDLPVVGGGGRRLTQGRRWTGKSLPCVNRLPPRPMKIICQIANPAKHESGKSGRPAATGLMNAFR